MATNIRVNSYRMDNEGRFHDVECLDRDYSGNLQKLINEVDLPNSENNKTVTITENGSVEITPSSGYDNMKKVTATVNVPTTSVTPPFWFTSGKDSVPPQEYINQIVFADNINSFDGVYGNSLFPDGTSTIAELYLARVTSATTVKSVSFIGTVPNGEGSPADIFVFLAL